MTRVRPVALAALAAALAACGPSTARDTAPDVAGGASIPQPAGWVVEEAPATATAELAPGSRVVLVAATSGARTVLSTDCSAAAWPVVHWDGARVLFTARTGSEATCLLECAPDGSARRAVVRHTTDCGRGAYLPDGRVVYAAALDGTDAGGRRSALFVAAGDGSPGARITFGAGRDFDPTVLSDGRVLFSSWRPGADGGRVGLFTVHPDGTGLAAFHLPAGDAYRARQRADGDVHYTLRAADGDHACVTSWDAPMHGARAADESPVVVADGFRALECVPLTAGRRPQGHLSSRREDRPYGTLVCVDARPESTGASVAFDALVLDGAGAVARTLGAADLAADGSFAVRVPVDTPLALHVRDAAGRTVATDHGPLWLRNNETRVCVGCHDDVETGPPNRRPQAVLGTHVDLSGGGE